jgi:hypothetical protein
MSTPTSDPANPTSNTPLSPLSHPARTSTFPHQTSPGVTSQTRLIDTNTRAINDAPVELDGSAVGDTVGGDVERRKGSVLSPADEEDIDAEFLGEGGQGGRGVKVGEVCLISLVLIRTLELGVYCEADMMAMNRNEQPC